MVGAFPCDGVAFSIRCDTPAAPLSRFSCTAPETLEPNSARTVTSSQPLRAVLVALSDNATVTLVDVFDGEVVELPVVEDAVVELAQLVPITYEI